MVMFCHIAVDLAVFVGLANSVDDGKNHPGNLSETAKRIHQVGHRIAERA